MYLKVQAMWPLHRALYRGPVPVNPDQSSTPGAFVRACRSRGHPLDPSTPLPDGRSSCPTEIDRWRRSAPPAGPLPRSFADVRGDGAVPGGAIQPPGLGPALVIVLVADARQPVGRCAIVDTGLLVRRQDGDAGDLEGRTGRLRRRAPPAPGAGGRVVQPARLTRRRSPGPLCCLAHDDRCVLLQDAQADLLDFIAQRGGPFEFECLGGGLHLGLHPCDQGLHLGSIG